VREDAQADIYRLDPYAASAAVRVTMTVPGERVFGDADATEECDLGDPRRARFDAATVERAARWFPGAVILERIKPVGYHTWANDTLLALFVLGSPNTLQLASTTTGAATRSSRSDRTLATPRGTVR
jgi:hypothetical protein